MRVPLLPSLSPSLSAPPTAGLTTGGGGGVTADGLCGWGREAAAGAADEIGAIDITFSG